MWTVYLLYHFVHSRTYIGCTTDVNRRLRQHNKEIKGGAKSTSRFAPGWQVYCTLNGFKDRSEAMRWEKILKCRFRGLKPRSLAFRDVSKGICPGKGKQYPVPKNIRYEFSIFRGTVLDESVSSNK